MQLFRKDSHFYICLTHIVWKKVGRSSPSLLDSLPLLLPSLRPLRSMREKFSKTNVLSEVEIEAFKPLKEALSSP